MAMRQRAVNEKAVEKIVELLNQFRLHEHHKIPFNVSGYQKHKNISAATLSALRSLSFVYKDAKRPSGWYFPVRTDIGYRDIAIKALEFLRQRNQKGSDNPIEPSWVPEILSIKQLLVEIRDNIAKTESASKGLKSALNRRADLVYLAGQIASGIYSICEMKHLHGGQGIDCNDLAIDYAEDLLKKIEERSHAN